MSNQVATVGQIGTLVPTQIEEIAPGDTWSGKQGLLIRLSPLKRALLTDLFVDSFTFYVPHRLVMADWENFIAAGPEDTPTYSVPTRTLPVSTNNYGPLFWATNGTEAVDYSALRLYAYNLIWNEYFRDEQQGLRANNTAPGEFGAPVNFKKDYLTNFPFDLGHLQEDQFVDTNAGSGTQVSATEILRAIAKQKIAMKRATYGSRYIDVLRSYGVNVNYQMLQRPELVAIGRGTVNVTDVVQTGDTQAEVGLLAGHGIAGQRLRLRRKTFPEHGTLMSFVVVRPVMLDERFTDWFDRPRDYTSFYDPGLVPLPSVLVEKKDVMNNVLIANQTDKIGYQQWGNWYRNSLSRVHPTLGDEWVPGANVFSDAFITDSLKTIAPAGYDSLFNDTSFGHYQVSAVNNFRALRFIPRNNEATVTGMGG